MRVLGIDPGTLNLGWGLIETDPKNKIVRVEHHYIAAPAKSPFYERLHLIGKELNVLLKDLQPDVAVIEKIFLGKNVDSAFKLGHIRGICAVRCHEVGAAIQEYTPRTVKKQITGSGQADKTLVQNFLYRQLGMKVNPKANCDASDALALAFCHILKDSVISKMQNMEIR